MIATFNRSMSTFCYVYNFMFWLGNRKSKIGKLANKKKQPIRIKQLLKIVIGEKLINRKNRMPRNPPIRIKPGFQSRIHLKGMPI